MEKKTLKIFFYQEQDFFLFSKKSVTTKITIKKQLL